MGIQIFDSNNMEKRYNIQWEELVPMFVIPIDWDFLCNVQKEEQLDPFYRSIRNYFLLYFRYNDRSSANKNNPILTKLYTGYFCVSEVISIYFGENWLRFGYIHPFHIHEIWRLQISTLKFIFSYEYLPYVHPQSTVKKTVSLKI